MTPERWKQVQEKLDIAIALAAEERESFLVQLGRSDHELRQEVELHFFWQRGHFRGADFIKDDLEHDDWDSGRFGAEGIVFLTFFRSVGERWLAR